MGKRLLMNGTEPMVDQGEWHGWKMSWNPDDGRFYVAKGDKTCTFKSWRNATYYAKTH